MKDITKKQQALLDEIKSFINENGYSPTIRELRERLGKGSTSEVYNMIKIIESKGYISREPGKSRTIKIIENDSRKDES